MARVRHLRNAPIAEAIIEIQVAPGDPQEGIFSGEAPLVDGYPKKSTRVTNNFELNVTAGHAAARAVAASTGFRFASDDGVHVVDWSGSSFAFHRLRPYTEWAQIRQEACQLWSKYLEFAAPAAVTRIGVRYVNRLELPVAEDMKESLVAGPTTPPNLPQSVKAFVSRIEIEDSANGRTGIISQAIEGLTETGEVAYLLDVDAIKAASCRPDDPAVWTTADKLRDFKNEMFFESVTERLLRRYE